MIIASRHPTVTVDRATIGGGLYVPPDCVPQAVAAARILSRPNPEYKRWLLRSRKLGRPAGDQPPETYVSAGPMFGGPFDGGWWLPRHAPVRVLNPTSAMVLPEAEPVTLSVELRPFQVDAVEALLWEQSGTIVAPCGAGKTTIGAALISRVATPALVLVHTLDLAEQWKDRCRAQLGVEAGMLGAGERDLDARVVVGTIQTLAQWSWDEVYELGQRFGLVVLDEAHHAPARTFGQVLSALPGRYRVGLTATPKRQDHLEDFLFWSCGRVVYTVRQLELEAAGYTLTPRITWLGTAFKPRTASDDWTGLCTELAGDEERNALIVREVAARAEAGRTVLVLADRVAHCEGLADQLAVTHPSACLVGRMRKTARADVLERFRSGELRVVTATSLADEGLDVSRIDCVALVTPSRNESRVQQRVGRGLRPQPGKPQPEVLDLVDPFGAALGAASRRRSLYRRLGWNPPPLPDMRGAA